MMARKPCSHLLLSLIILVFLIVLQVCPIAHSTRSTAALQNEKPAAASASASSSASPYAFLKGLQGSQLGNSNKGLTQLKQYLAQFGYLQIENQTHLNTDEFDTHLQSALKTYQQNYGIAPTGTLDAATVSKMTSPRCGVPDIVNGVNTMSHHPHSQSFQSVAHYSFFPNNPRWPASKTSLTYRFIPGTRADGIAAVGGAFQSWQRATHFRFSRVSDYGPSDLVIGFFSRAHGDGYPFDGPYGTLAHAFAPTNGRFHYDADENWVNGSDPNGFNLQTVAAHEIGHLLGLGHSTVESAIMYPSIGLGEVKGLDPDDIQGIKVLYNV